MGVSGALDGAVRDGTAHSGTTPVVPNRGAGQPVLSLRDLVVEFTTSAGVVRAVDGLSYEVLNICLATSACARGLVNCVHLHECGLGQSRAVDTGADSPLPIP